MSEIAGRMIILFILMLVCSCLGIAAFVMCFKKCKKEGFALDWKNYECNINSEPYSNLPEPVVFKNKDCLKNFWDENKHINDMINKHASLIDNRAQSIKNYINVKYPSIQIKLKYRLKSKQSILNKQREINDITGIRIIINDTDNVAKKIFTDLQLDAKNGYPLLPHGFCIINTKSYQPRSNGYRGFHLIVTDSTAGYSKYQRYEIQIRTHLQNIWTHWSHNNIYKPHIYRNKDEMEIEKIKSYLREMSDYISEQENGNAYIKLPILNIDSLDEIDLNAPFNEQD
jgi:ppGpp synthetase/RelA/SpoT-type nucleotidyltranferase